MRAHFAIDVDVGEQQQQQITVKKDNKQKQRSAKFACAEVEVEVQEKKLETRIDDFKHDTKNMSIVEEFIDDVLKNAEAEVEIQQQQQQQQQHQQQTQQTQETQQQEHAKPSKEKRASFNIPDFKNGKVVNRARGLVVRLFDAICNCANTAAAPAARIKLRGKRAATLNGTSNTNSLDTEANDIDNDKPEKRDAKEKFKKEKSEDLLELRNVNKAE